jgi:hypothetical protein
MDEKSLANRKVDGMPTFLKGFLNSVLIISYSDS